MMTSMNSVSYYLLLMIIKSTLIIIINGMPMQAPGAVVCVRIDVIHTMSWLDTVMGYYRGLVVLVLFVVVLHLVCQYRTWRNK